MSDLLAVGGVGGGRLDDFWVVRGRRIGRLIGDWGLGGGGLGDFLAGGFGDFGFFVDTATDGGSF